MFYQGKLTVVDDNFQSKYRGRTPKKLVCDESGVQYVLKCRSQSHVNNVISAIAERLAYVISLHLPFNVPVVMLITDPIKYGFSCPEESYGCLIKYIEGLRMQKIISVEEKQLAEVFDLIMNSICQAVSVGKTEAGDLYFIDNEHAMPWSDRMLSHIDGVLTWSKGEAADAVRQFGKLSDAQIEEIIEMSFCEDNNFRSAQKTCYWLKSLRDIFGAGEWDYSAWTNDRKEEYI